MEEEKNLVGRIDHRLRSVEPLRALTLSVSTS